MKKIVIVVVLLLCVAVGLAGFIKLRKGKAPSCLLDSVAGQCVQSKITEDIPKEETKRKPSFMSEFDGDKPAFVIFGGSTCCGGDVMFSVAEELMDESSNTLQVLYIDALFDRATAIGLGVEILPTMILYDANGKEQTRFTNQMSVVEIEEKLQAEGIVTASAVNRTGECN